jgi:RimJ/RimL family protein N-acetyltransferase
MHTPLFCPTPVTLASALVRLEPLSVKHAPDLFKAAAEKTVWSYMPIRGFTTPGETETWIEESAASGDVPFAIVLQATNTAVGSTRYMDIRRPHRGLEIGWTWISPEFQRTGVNTHAKYLLLRHAFEELRAIRVQLKTDIRNTRSQLAIERLGAVKEGILRRHIQVWDGHIRDTIYYSILDSEWPNVKARLEKSLDTF